MGYHHRTEEIQVWECGLMDGGGGTYQTVLERDEENWATQLGNLGQEVDEVVGSLR